MDNPVSLTLHCSEQGSNDSSLIAHTYGLTSNERIVLLTVHTMCFTSQRVIKKRIGTVNTPACITTVVVVPIIYIWGLIHCDENFTGVNFYWKQMNTMLFLTTA